MVCRDNLLFLILVDLLVGLITTNLALGVLTSHYLQGFQYSLTNYQRIIQRAIFVAYVFQKDGIYHPNV